MGATAVGDAGEIADGRVVRSDGSSHPTPLLVDGRVAPLADDAPPTLESAILDATLTCVARWGVAKTTLDDVAREAGCSRATVYRLVPGGKDGLMEAVAERELLRFFGHLAARLDREPTVAGRVALALAESVRVLQGHAALGAINEHEPELLLPFVSFDALDPLLEAAASFGAELLGASLAPLEAREAGEWVARIALSYGLEPADGVDLTDLAVANEFVRRYLPHLTTAGSPDPTPTAPRRTEKELLHVHH